MTVAETARLMRVSTMSVYRLIRAGSLRASRNGNRYLIRKADALDYLSKSYLRAV